MLETNGEKSSASDSVGEVNLKMSNFCNRIGKFITAISSGKLELTMKPEKRSYGLTERNKTDQRKLGFNEMGQNSFKHGQ